MCLGAFQILCAAISAASESVPLTQCSKGIPCRSGLHEQIFNSGCAVYDCRCALSFSALHAASRLLLLMALLRAHGNKPLPSSQGRQRSRPNQHGSATVPCAPWRIVWRVVLESGTVRHVRQGDVQGGTAAAPTSPTSPGKSGETLRPGDSQPFSDDDSNARFMRLVQQSAAEVISVATPPPIHPPLLSFISPGDFSLQTRHNALPRSPARMSCRARPLQRLLLLTQMRISFGNIGIAAHASILCVAA